jgi:hypothetical protein
MSTRVLRVCAPCVVALVLGAVSAGPVEAQFGPPPPPDTRTPRERATIDLTGQWVAVITEDWRWRMVTPPVGDTASLPLNERGRAAAGQWNLERDRAEGNLCRAFGPPGLIRQPTRVRIEWDDDDTLQLEFDAGRQTRRFEFGASTPGEPSLQGYSLARWFRQPQSRGVFGVRTPSEGGSLVVETSRLTGGYLRANGAPYSERATIKEFFQTFTLPGDAGSWLIVTTVVADPDYLTSELILSTQFKKEATRAGWNPRPCAIADPPPAAIPPRRAAND